MEPAQDEDLTGQTVGRYVIVALIAIGGQGRVYRGRDTVLHRDVAIKVPRPARAGSRQALLDEAKTLSRLDDPHIVPIYDLVTGRDRPHLVMEYVAGATIRDILAAGPLPAAEVTRLGAEIALGLAAAHGGHVVHCDIKPSNLKVTSSGHLKILDFGIARIMRSAVGMEDAIGTRSHSIMGTVRYMAPEQVRGEEVDGRTDLFSLGSVLYEMATGYRAFPHDEVPRLIQAIQHEEPVPPSILNPHVPPAVEQVITQAMRKDPRLRQQSAMQMAGTLEGLQRDAHRKSAAAAPRTTTMMKVPRPVRRGPRRQELPSGVPARG